MSTAGLSNLETIGDDLTILGNGGLTNLDGLSSLTHVGDDLSVTDNIYLSSVDGLASLVSVDRVVFYNNPLVTLLPVFDALTTLGGLYIAGMHGLTHIDGLSGITALSDGSLTLEGNNSLSNVDGLIGLASVAGDVVVEGNSSLSGLDGLVNLSSVSGSLVIESNAVLTEVDGLSGLSSAGSVLVRGNDSLTQIDGLANLSLVNDISIIRNNSLRNIDGLIGLENVGEDLVIDYNQGIVDVDGLSALRSVEGSLHITHSFALSDIDGLSALGHVGADLVISSSRITDVDGLVNLETVGERLEFSVNQSLINLDGLANLESVGSEVLLLGNRNLIDCEALAPVFGYPDVDPLGPTLRVQSAPAGCSSVDEIFQSVVLPTPPSIVHAAVGNGFADISFSSSPVQSDVFPVTRYVAQCAGNQLSIMGNTPAVISPAIEKTEVAASFINFGPHLADTRFIIWYEIEHERPDLLTVTLQSPSGHRYILRDGINAPATRFKEVTYVDPPEFAPPRSDVPGFIVSVPPGDISGLMNEAIDSGSLRS